MTLPLYRLGLVEYEEAVRLQLAYQAKVIEGTRPSALFLLEHPPTVTLGASFHEENLRLNRPDYMARGLSVFESGRGGDVTYHGPGQLIGYPIFDLRLFGKDLHLWLRNLEEVMIRALAELGLEACRFPPHTGVWINQKKIAAMGVKVSRWTSIHGFALNINNDMEPFDTIVPCGIQSYGVTSAQEEFDRPVAVDELVDPIRRGFESVFDIVLEDRDWQ